MSSETVDHRIDDRRQSSKEPDDAEKDVPSPAREHFPRRDRATAIAEADEGIVAGHVGDRADRAVWEAVAFHEFNRRIALRTMVAWKQASALRAGRLRRSLGCNVAVMGSG